MRYLLATNRLADVLDPAGWLEHVADISDISDVRYVFLPFWSQKVPKQITDKVECVCFHMTDLPYGRGGSPLQNLILRGHTETVISAIRMTDELDAGPVYMKRPLSLEGSAQEIYRRAAAVIAGMMIDIAVLEPTPVPQDGEVVTFKRREPEESEIAPALFHGRRRQLYDFIRMLDADGYPRAFVGKGPSGRVEFSDAHILDDGRVIAKVIIT